MDFINRLKDAFLALPYGRKIGALVLALVAFGAVYYLSLPMRGLDMVPLYGRLSTEDAGSVVDKLTNDGVRFRLSNGGRTISVPSRQVYSLLLKLSQQGLPKGEGEGLEILDQSPLGVSDFTQKVHYQRALQGELTQTISAMDGVENARVHLVFPEDSPFLDATDGARASVVLTLRQNTPLDRRQISGLVHLVSGAVKGLKSENVSILDNEGRLLAGGRSDTGVYGRGNELLDLQREAEHYLEEKTSTLLETLLGPGRAIVRVRVEMDDRVVKEQTNTYDAGGPLRSEQQTAAPSSEPSFVKNYEVGSTVREIVASPGAVKKLYVSVAVDGTTKDDPQKPGTPLYTPRTPDEMSSIEALVRQAVGFSEDREDQMEVKNIAFDTTHRNEIQAERLQGEEALKKDRTRQMLSTLGGPIGSALAIVTVVFLFYKFLKSGSSSPVLEAPSLTQTAPDVPAVSMGTTPSPAPERTPVPALASTAGEGNLLDAARKNPAGVARLMQQQFLARPS